MEIGAWLFVFVILSIISLVVLGISSIIYLLIRGLVERFRSDSRYLTPKWIKFYIFLLVFAFLGYQIYTAIYPTESFYREEYLRLTEREFPKSAKIIYKDTSYPDHFGKYYSVSHIEVSEEDFHQLLNDIENDKDFSWTRPNEPDQPKSFFKKRIKNSKRGKGYLTFLKDKKTIVCYLDFY